MDNLDKRIFTELQNNFPLEERPYDIIAERLGITTDQLYQRVKRLLEDGVIRRMGASLDSRKLGFDSTLVAMKVDTQSVEKAGDLLLTYPEITHSYTRDDQFNIWFTVIACDTWRIGVILEDIRIRLGLDKTNILNLPMERLFKLDARFKPADR